VILDHALRRMRQRGITEEEVPQALGDVIAQTDARTWNRVNLWGRTRSARILRITTYRDNRSNVVTVVAPRKGPT
jgi:hypothetical protein